MGGGELFKKITATLLNCDVKANSFKDRDPCSENEFKKQQTAPLKCKK